MSDQTKPPLIVWIMENPNHPGTGLFKGKCSPLWDQGPYVHLEQFMALVESRASSFTSLKYGVSVCEALKQIKQELESGE